MSSNKTGSTRVFNVSDGTLTLKNGNLTSASRLGQASGSGKIVIESGTYTSTMQVAFQALNGGKVTLNGGTIISQEGGIIAPSANGIIEVNGGVIETSDNFAIATNGNEGNNGNQITINGGHLEGNIKSAGYEAIGIYIANNDTLTINGGEIIANGGTGICMRAGHVTINDGTITATGVDKNGNPVADGKIGDDNRIMTGVSAIVYDEAANYKGNIAKDMSLVINGGTITGVDKSIDPVMNEGATPIITISGGTLTPAYPAA